MNTGSSSTPSDMIPKVAINNATKRATERKMITPRYYLNMSPSPPSFIEVVIYKPVDVKIAW